MASATKQWAALQLQHQLRQASTPEERAAVHRQIERAKIDPSYRRKLAEAGEHGEWSSGPTMAAKYALAAGSLIPGVNLVAGPALAALAVPTAMESYERAQSGLPWGWQAVESAADLLLPGIGRGGTSLLRGLKGSKAAEKVAGTVGGTVRREGGRKILRSNYRTGQADPLVVDTGQKSGLRSQYINQTPDDLADLARKEAEGQVGRNMGREVDRYVKESVGTVQHTDRPSGAGFTWGRPLSKSKLDWRQQPELPKGSLGKMRKSYEQARRDAATRPTATDIRRELGDVQAGFKTDLMRALDDLPRGRPRRDIGVVQETDRLGRPLSGSKLGDWRSPDLRKSKIGDTAGVKLSKLAQAAGEYGDSPLGQAAWKVTLDAQRQAQRAATGVDKFGRKVKGITEDTWVKGAKSDEYVNPKTGAVVTETQIAKMAARLSKDPIYGKFSQEQLRARAREILMPTPKKPGKGGAPVGGGGTNVTGVTPAHRQVVKTGAGVGTKLAGDATSGAKPVLAGDATSGAKPVVEGVEQAAQTGAAVPKVVDEGRLPVEIESAIRFARKKIDQAGSRGPGEDAAMDYIQDFLLPNWSREQQNIFVQGTREGKLTGEASQLAKETISDLYRTTSGKAGGKPVTGMIGSQYKRLTQKMPKGRPSPDVQKKITATLGSVGSKEAAAAQETMSRFILMNPSIKKILDTGGKVTRKDLEKNKFAGLADYMKWNTDGTLDLTTNPKGGIRWLGNKVENVKNPQGQNTVLRAALNVVQMNRISAMSKIIEQMVGRTLKGKKVPGGASGWAKKTFADPTAERADLHTGIFFDVLEKGLPATGTGAKGTGRFEAATAAIGDFEKELGMLLAMITGASALGGASLPSREI
jgi:hypothetical protein